MKATNAYKCLYIFVSFIALLNKLQCLVKQILLITNINKINIKSLNFTLSLLVEL